MKSKDIIAVLLVGGGLFFAYQAFTASQRRNNFRGIQYPPPPPPTSNQQEWQTWASAILNIFGSVKELWEPGGPFYKEKDNLDIILGDFDPDDVSNIV